MIVLSGADVVVPGRVLSPATVVVEGDRIAEVLPGSRPGGAEGHRDLAGHVVVPGFIDVHVHGVAGTDTLDGDAAIASIAARLPAFGVTAFCPTSIACDPVTLAGMLEAVRRARTAPSGGARVLPAHLESNFISPEYNGAQPIECLRAPRGPSADGVFTGQDILDTIAAASPDVGIVTVAPELDGALELVARLVGQGHRVSLGHSGASYDQAIAGIEAGARHATHLFNRMPPLGHRAPGLAGAVLEHDGIAAELICDGVHVHPAMIKLALAAKHPERIMAITDATAGAGLPRGAKASLGGRTITVGDAAYLDDGTIAGSVLTMDRAFATLVGAAGTSLVDAAAVCSTTPARELGLHNLGLIAPGALADLVVLDRALRVTETYVAGRLVFSREQGTGYPRSPSIPL
jgi:N-acetylglucosamine-6-phosphate deacetylase